MDLLRNFFKSDKTKQAELCAADTTKCNDEKQKCEDSLKSYNTDLGSSEFKVVDPAELKLNYTYYQKYHNDKNVIRYFPGIWIEEEVVYDTDQHSIGVKTNDENLRAGISTPTIKKFVIDNQKSIEKAEFSLVKADNTKYYIPTDGTNAIYNMKLRNQQYLEEIQLQNEEIKRLDKEIQTLSTQKLRSGGRKYNRTRKNLITSKYHRN
jgi:hypothetical protein